MTPDSRFITGFGYALRHASDALTEEEIRDYESVIRWATETFTTQRYNAHVGGFRTWPATAHRPYEGEFEINSDMVMNLEMPIYVAKAEGDMDLVDKNCPTCGHDLATHGVQGWR